MNLIEYIRERKLLDRLNTLGIHRNYNTVKRVMDRTVIKHSKISLQGFGKQIENLENEIDRTNKKLQDMFYKKIQPPRLIQSYSNYEEKKHMDVEIIADDYWEDELKEAVMSKIKKHINYQFPGCEIGPRTSYWTKELVGMDPLFLIGPDLNSIEHVKSQFNQIYQRRLRIYQTEESDLSYLPKGAFSFVFSWHHFEFLPYDIIDQYLEGIFKMLRPGGVALLSYANCLLEKAAQNFEDHYYCYMTQALMEGLANKNGFDIVENRDHQFRLSWVIIKKPGYLGHGIKHVPSVGIIKERRNDPIP